MPAYKESPGFSRRTYEDWLRDFASYFTKKGIQEFSADSITPWIAKRDTEGDSGFRKRATVLWEFSKYPGTRQPLCNSYRERKNDTDCTNHEKDL